MEDDYYRYDEKNKRLVGRHSRKIYNLGERVKVQLIRVNKEEREIDFNLVSEKGTGKQKKRKGRFRD